MADTEQARAAAEPGPGRAAGPPPATGGPHAPAVSTSPDREFTVESRSQGQLILRRFMAHRLAVASLILFFLIAAASLIGGRFWTWSYTEITPEFSTPPSLAHPMGTDSIGHDVLALVLRGAQKSVQVALLVALLSTGFGTLLGAIAGYYRGWVDAALMRVTDIALTVPSLALLAVLSAVLVEQSGSWVFVSIVIALLYWTTIARVVRGVFLSLREKEYVEAAKALGASDSRIIFRHLLPNTTGPIIVNATVAVAVAILIEASLSYLGIGIRPPDTSLGLLISEGQQAATTRPWLFYFPGVFIILICLTVNFVGDGLRDAFDPQQTRVRA
jgi:peptide/nickel transport system permease protein